MILNYENIDVMEVGNMWDLQKILGHSDIQTTDKYYGHFDKQHIVRRVSVVSFGEKVIEVDFGKGVA